MGEALSDRKNRQRWQVWIWRGVKGAILLVLASIVAISIDYLWDRLTSHTYWQLNVWHVIRLTVTSFLGILILMLFVILLVDTLILNSRILLRGYRILRYSGESKSDASSEITGAKLILLVRIALIVAVVVTLGSVTIAPWWKSTNETIDQNVESYNHIEEAERLMFDGNWDYHPNFRPWSGPLVSSWDYLGHHTTAANYRFPKTCATFIMPVELIDRTFGFGFRFYSYPLDSDVRIGVRSDYSTFFDVGTEREISVSGDALVFNAMDRHLIDIEQGSSTTLCTIVTEDVIYLFAGGVPSNVELTRAYENPFGGEFLSVGVMFSAEKYGEEGVEHTMEVGGFTVWYSPSNIALPDPATPLPPSTPAPNAIPLL